MQNTYILKALRSSVMQSLNYFIINNQFFFFAYVNQSFIMNKSSNRCAQLYCWTETIASTTGSESIKKKRIWPTKKLTFQKRWENYYHLHAWQYIRLSVTTFYLDQIINNNRLIHIHNRLIISWITYYNNTCVLQFPFS